MLISGLLGQMMMRSARDGLRARPARARRFHAFEANAAHDRFGAAFHEIFLKMQCAFARVDDGGDGLVGHREDARLHSERGANRFGRVVTATFLRRAWRCDGCAWPDRGRRD